MAVQEAHGRLATGTCYFVNMAGAPLVQKVLGEPVHVCAGFARYVDRHDIIQTGFRWRPAKWERWIDATVGASCEPLGDVHCWLETTSHFIDFDGGTGDPNDVWPPLIYRPKATLAKHPRDTDSTGAILVWRNSEARDFVGSQLAPLVLPIASRAVEIFDVFVNGSQVERQEETMGHEFVMSLARRALTTCSEVAWAQAWAQCMGLAAGEAPQSLSGPPENKQAAIEIIEPRRLQKGTPHAA